MDNEYSGTNPDKQLNALIEEENHYTRLSQVFGTPDGIKIFEWLLEACGYWREHIIEERLQGKFELGRFLFNQLSLADIDLVHTILDRRRKEAERYRQLEKKRVEETIRTTQR